MFGSPPAPDSQPACTTAARRSCVRGRSPCEANRSAWRGSQPPRATSFGRHSSLTCSGLRRVHLTGRWLHNAVGAHIDFGDIRSTGFGPCLWHFPSSSCTPPSMYTSTAGPVISMPKLKASKVRGNQEHFPAQNINPVARTHANHRLIHPSSL